MSTANLLASQAWLSAGTDRRQPMDYWRAALAAESEETSRSLLRAAYEAHWPTQGELIFTGACDFACEHCIYPPQFAGANRSMSVDDWRRIIERCDRDLGLGTYVYGGRSLPPEGVDVLQAIRATAPTARLGFIDNGLSSMAMRERLPGLALDWIDVSLDGLEADHDRQRRRAGSFRAGLAGAEWFVENGVAPKVNILTCLTTLNRGSVVAMIRELNGRGFRNFVVTPVTTVEGVRPAAGLRLSAEQFTTFLDELQSSLHELEDAWIEVGFFGVEYAAYLARQRPDLWARMRDGRDSCTWTTGPQRGRAGTECELHVAYYPSSLTGTREFIVNTNGDVIVPKSMARGRIAPEHKLGNLRVIDPAEIVASMPVRDGWSFYVQELKAERAFLRGYADGNF